MLAFPFDIGLVGGGPFVVDFDEHSADEAHQRIFIRKDAHLLGSAFDFLLDGALNGIGWPRR